MSPPGWICDILKWDKQTNSHALVMDQIWSNDFSQFFFFFNDPIWPDHRWWFRGNHMELSPSGFISGRWIIRTFPDDRMICTMWRVGLDYITHLLGVGQWIILISPDSSCFQGHYIYHSIPITLISLLYSYYIPTISSMYTRYIPILYIHEQFVFHDGIF